MSRSCSDARWSGARCAAGEAALAAGCPHVERDWPLQPVADSGAQPRPQDCAERRGRSAAEATQRLAVVEECLRRDAGLDGQEHVSDWFGRASWEKEGTVLRRAGLAQDDGPPDHLADGLGQISNRPGFITSQFVDLPSVPVSSEHNCGGDRIVGAGCG